MSLSQVIVSYMWRLMHEYSMGSEQLARHFINPRILVDRNIPRNIISRIKRRPLDTIPSLYAFKETLYSKFRHPFLASKYLDYFGSRAKCNPGSCATQQQKLAAWGRPAPDSQAAWMDFAAEAIRFGKQEWGTGLCLLL